MSMSNNNVQNEKEKRINPWTSEDKEKLIELYPYKTNNELCLILDKTEGQLRGMKERLGLNAKFKPFTIEEKNKIEEFYQNNPNELDLDNFATELGRPKTSISRYANKLNLTKNNRPFSDSAKERLKDGLYEFMQTDEYIKNIKPQQANLLSYYARNQHPKGMLNKHHSDETRKQMSITHVELARNMTPEDKHNIAMKGVETKRKNGGFNTTLNAYSRCRGGYRKDLEQYFRSSWEANIARLLNYLNIEWLYEFKRFNFDEESHEVLSYQPDFYLPQYDKWIEVKGWMDDKSKKRLELFNLYYPHESSNLILIDENKYHLLENKYINVIYNWETKGQHIED